MVVGTCVTEIMEPKRCLQEAGQPDADDAAFSHTHVCAQDLVSAEGMAWFDVMQGLTGQWNGTRLASSWSGRHSTRLPKPPQHALELVLLGGGVRCGGKKQGLLQRAFRTIGHVVDTVALLIPGHLGPRAIPRTGRPHQVDKR